jgi:hypothetical protein
VCDSKGVPSRYLPLLGLWLEALSQPQMEVEVHGNRIDTGGGVMLQITSPVTVYPPCPP